MIFISNIAIDNGGAIDSKRILLLISVNLLSFDGSIYSFNTSSINYRFINSSADLKTAKYT